MLIKSLHLKNILSFKDTKLDLQPLNVLIGPNGSGKSNLIDVIGLLQAVPIDIAGFLRNNGPTGDWIWKGSGRSEKSVQIAGISALMDVSGSCIAYDLQLSVSRNQLLPVLERVDVVDLVDGKRHLSAPVFQAENGSVQLWSDNNADGGAFPRSDSDDPSIAKVAPLKSVFSDIQLVTQSEVLQGMFFLMRNVKIYRNWNVSRNSTIRQPQPTDGSLDFLEEDFSNLALVINNLREKYGLGTVLDEYLQRFYESHKSLHTPVEGGNLSLTVRESGTSGTLPASRLSDGTIRFIALLAILCHPEPPPLICIEEPEIAMHPDSLGLIAELLRKASERTQIIVATHSPELVSHFSDEPEHIVVCDRDAKEGTQFRRLSRQDLDEWQEIYQQTGKELVVYGLSEMWMSGSFGGVRW